MQKEPLFPLFCSLAGRPVLVVGGGKVALRRAEALAESGANITVVSPEILDAMQSAKNVQIERRPFLPQDIMQKALVVAATDDSGLNVQIAQLCRARKIPVSVADNPAEGSVVFPAVVRRGGVSVGISTGGASPAAAAYLRRSIEAVIPPQMGDITAYLADCREKVRAQLVDCPQSVRAEVFTALFDACMAKGGPLNEDEFAYYIENVQNKTAYDKLKCAEIKDSCIKYADKEEKDANNIIKYANKKASAKGAVGRVYLVGAGCGGADWLTLRAMQLLLRCSAVVYDALIDPAILALVPPTALRIPAGKRAGQPSVPQQETNQTLVRLGLQGHTVVRLKGGDPFVFGRGGEEVEALQGANVPFEVVPGISSSIAIPGQAGIPVTHRRVSRSFTVVTGHTADAALPEDLETLARLQGTLVFLMGLEALPRIAEGLIAAGKPASTPAAVVSGGNAPHPANVRGTLADIARRVQQAAVQPPAIIVVGAAAALDFRGETAFL